MSNILLRLKSLLQPRNQCVLGIDIGTGTIKILEGYCCAANVVLQKVIMLPLPSTDRVDTIAMYAQLIERTMQIHGIKAKYAVLALDKRNFFSREIEFPRLAADELAEAIKWKIEQYVPYTEDSYYYDFTVLENNQSENKCKAILTAAPKKIIDYWVDVFQGTPLKLLAIEGEMFALERLIRGEKDYLLIDIGQKIGQVILYQNSVPVVVRSISVFGDRFTAAIAEELQLTLAEAEALKQRLASPVEECLHHAWQTVIEELAAEAMRTIEYYQVQNRQAQAKRIFLCGGGARLPELTEDLAKCVNLPIVLVNQLEFLPCAKELSAVYLQNIMPQAAVAAGLLLRGDLS